MRLVGQPRFNRAPSMYVPAHAHQDGVQQIEDEEDDGHVSVEADGLLGAVDLHIYVHVRMCTNPVSPVPPPIRHCIAHMYVYIHGTHMTWS